jgi:tetratricopeptide (TPR) repeat protein
MKKIRPQWTHWDFELDFHGWAPQRVIRRFDNPQSDVEIALLEDILAEKTDHIEAMKQLAELYTQAGHYREGLEMDRRIVRARPMDAIAQYNLACSLSLCDMLDDAFKALGRAMRLGYRDYEHMWNDPDLQQARCDPRWEELFSLSET